MTDELAAIRRPFDVARPRAAARRAGVGRHRPRPDAVSSSTRAASSSRPRPPTPFIAGVVGWVGPRRARPSPTTSPRSARCRAATGSSGSATRSTTSRIRPGCSARTSAAASRAVGAAGLAYDLLVRARELPAAARGRPVAAATSGSSSTTSRKPPIARRRRSAAWARAHRAVRGAAERRRASSRASSPRPTGRPGRSTDLRPASDRARSRCSGRERLLFGSDWPVCLLAAPYERVVDDGATPWSAGLTADERAAVMGGTAVEVYGLRSADRSAPAGAASERVDSSRGSCAGRRAGRARARASRGP